LRAVNPEAMLLHLRTAPPAEYAGGHATQFLLQQLHAYPAVEKAVEQMLRSISDRGVSFRAGGENTIIHPGSGSREKCWPLDRFIELAQRLGSAGHSVRFLAGEVERERLADADFQRMSRVASVRMLDSYVELLRELTDARLYIGNDSGPTHLAGITGVPTVALFGETNPDLWRPLGPDVRIARADQMDQIALDEVNRLAVR
jgi:ADP-heptose:LPS heptosyltransferase